MHTFAEKSKTIQPASTTNARSHFRPKLKVNSFNIPEWQVHRNQIRTILGRDKSIIPSNDDQDQNASVSSFSKTGRGVSIEVEPEGAFSSPDYPDGFRWAQTIETNTKKGGSILASPVTYVDPTPNDDSKPFYWTDAEHDTHSGVFKDSPSRNPRPAGTVNWDATLSLNGVNGKNAERYDSTSYGFSVDSAGTVTARDPTSPASLANHMSTLRSEFPSWTFK